MLAAINSPQEKKEHWPPKSPLSSRDWALP